MLGGTTDARNDLANAYVKFDKFIVGSNTSFNLHFKGCMDVFRIWDREGSETEVISNQKLSLVGNELGQKHYYRFDEGMRMIAFCECEADYELQLKEGCYLDCIWLSYLG